jgi:hypothetical protein
MPEETVVVAGNPADEQQPIESLLRKEGENWIVEYQPKGTDGNTIGPLTKYIGKTKNEVIQQLVEGKTNAERTIHRLKTVKPTPLQQPKTLTTDEEFQLGIELQNPQTAAKAIRKLVENDPSLAEEKRKARITQVTYDFLRSHQDEFYNCDANGKVLTDWLTENSLEYSVDNLEYALETCRERLALAPRAAPPVVPQPAPETPEEQQRQRSASSGIVPGQFSGTRPRTQIKPGLTRKDVLDLARTNYAEYKRRLGNPKERAEIYAALGESDPMTQI